MDYNKHLITDNKAEDNKRAKQLLMKYNKNRKGDQKLIRKDIENLVNSKYGNVSNDFVTIIWNEFNKMFPS